MPSIEANRAVWGQDYDWVGAGDEWSAAWGGPDVQWNWTLLPRLQPFLPAKRILEIAPGFGRWSSYLIPRAERYVGVDLSEIGVDACRQRFANFPQAEFHVNDGRSLSAVADGAVDLAFSFDSLVHVEADVMGSYLNELGTKLAPDGVAFLHHSNLAACKPLPRPWRSVFSAVERRHGREPVGFDYWRGASMSAARCEELARDAGLQCIGQEVITWLGSRYLDCISVLARPGSRWARPNVVTHNPYFMAEAASAASAGPAYTHPPASGSTAVDVDAAAQRSSVRFIGPLSTRIAYRALGPWAVTLLGPLPSRRGLPGRRRLGSS